MMATVPHVTSGSGLRKFQADGYLLDRVYKEEDIGEGGRGRRGITVGNGLHVENTPSIRMSQQQFATKR